MSRADRQTNTVAAGSPSNRPQTALVSQPSQALPRKEGRIRSFLRRNLFDEENIGLNSAKEISQTWDTNIDKITRFLEAKEHYVRYMLLCVAMIGGGFLYYKFKSLKLERRYLLERQKNVLITTYLLKEAFTKDVNVTTKNIGLYRSGVLDIRQCADFKSIWNGHFRQFEAPQEQPLLLVGRNGSGKTETLEKVFLELRHKQRMVAYSNLELCREESRSLTDILLHERHTSAIAARKFVEEHKGAVHKPVILLDNVQLLSSMPHRLQILREIEYLRWQRSCSFLMASVSREIDPENIIMDLRKYQFQGIFDSQFYPELIRKLKFGADEERILALRPNLYLLQQLCLTEDRQALLSKLSK